MYHVVQERTSEGLRSLDLGVFEAAGRRMNQRFSVDCWEVKTLDDNDSLEEHERRSLKNDVRND